MLFSTFSLPSCSKSNSEENIYTASLVFSNALNGVYSGVGTINGEQVTGNITLFVYGPKYGSYMGVLGDVFIVNVTKNGESNFDAKNQLNENNISLSFSGANYKTLTIVDGNSTFTGTKP